jgi:hypothetical protein
MAKLTPELREAVLARVAKKSTYKEAAAWLKTAHGVSISEQALCKLVRKHRSETKDVAKAIARAHVAKKLPADLAAADENLRKAQHAYDLAYDAVIETGSVADYDKLKKAAGILARFDEVNRKTLGLDSPDQEAVTDLAALLSR